MGAPTVMWFRRDLRLADNPALAEAAAAGPVVALFVVDPMFFGRAANPRQAFLVESLHALDAAIGGALVVRHGDPTEVVPAIAAEIGATVVHAAADYGPYGRRRDTAVAAGLAACARSLQLVGSSYAVAPGSVRTSTGGPYSVFTPFARAWRAAGWPRPLAAPAVDWTTLARRPGEALVDVAGIETQCPPAGEPAAHDALERFVAHGLVGYDTARDTPGVAGTSHLSPYLRFGVLHPRQLLARLGDAPSERRFRDELAWREFYADVLHHRPESAWANWHGRLDGLAVDTDLRAVERFAAWADGRTGYPIVDAGMRELMATGWMHNRVRMITASFLVKDLHLPWQWGARHFMAHLVDGDLASNNHGWQWVAGTGTDAAPFFRIFNPVTQSRTHDPDGAYLRRWLPELSGLDDKAIHAPWESNRGTPLGYVSPIVDHAAERVEALARYAAATERRR